MPKENISKATIEGQLKKCEEELNDSNNKLAKEKNDSEEYLIKLKYLQAEFENYKKRVIKEIENNRINYCVKLFRNIITPIEELEIATDKAQSNNPESIIEGVKMIVKKFKKILSEEGVNEIDSVGKIFDPKIHEAVLFEENDEYPDNCVIEELRKGYRFNDNIIRPSMVKVCRKKEDDKGGSEYD